MVSKKLLSSFLLAIVVLAGTALVSERAEAQAGPYQYFAVSPCRAYDTRSGGGGVINSATIRTFLIKTTCGVPQSAVAVSLNLTVTQPTAPGGDLRIAPFPGAFPNVSTLNYVAGDTLANGAIVPLGNPAAGQPDFQVLGAGCAGANCSNAFTYHLIIDVTGYFQ